MNEWNIDLMQESDVASVVMERMGRIEHFATAAEEARPTIERMQATLDEAIDDFVAGVRTYAARYPLTR